MTWQIIWSGPATGDMRRLDRSVAARIHAAVGRYAETSAGDIKRLRDREQEWRLRVGDWRVLFTLDGQARSMTILRVLPRGRAYRD